MIFKWICNRYDVDTETLKASYKHFRSLLNYRWNTLTTKQRGIFFVCLIAIIFLLLRACLHAPLSQVEYHIARPLNWNFLKISGKERNMQAFTDELLLAIADHEAIRIKIYAVSSETILETLNRQNYDAAIFNLVPAGYQEGYLFSEPYYHLGPILIIATDSPIQTVKDLSRKLVGVVNGQRLFTVRSLSSMSLVSYDNARAMIEDLIRGKLSAVVLDAWQAQTFIQGIYRDQIKALTGPLTDQGLRLMGLKNFKTKRLISDFNQGLEALKENGEYQRLLDKWGLFNTEPSKESLTEA